MSEVGRETVTIARLGGRGDGVADLGEGGVFVPFALAGERVEIAREGEGRARLLAVLSPSPERVAPFCPHFGRCGGCAVQHLAAEPYAAWKRGIVEGALRAARVPAEVAPLVDAHGAGRRRLTFHARRIGGMVAVGFMARQSHDLVAIEACPVAEPALHGAADAALALARLLAGANKPLDIQVTATEGGLDVDVRGHGRADEALRARLVAEAVALSLARLSLHGDVLVETRAPLVRMGRAAVVPAPGGFLQATAAGEAALAGLVTEACAGARRVADLFSGCGPFALRLAERAEVEAYESEAAAIAALDRAARATHGLRPVAAHARDLFRRPLLTPELARFDAVVIDPPRAGAEAQARQLAASGVPVVASVSCDPGTFARDAALLVAGGYTLDRVVPVDQFRHTAHVEIVGVFRKAAKRGGRR